MKVRDPKEGIKVIKTELKFEKAHENNAGYDVRANCSTPVAILPGGIKSIDTGLFLDIPIGMEGQVRSRLGLSMKFGIIVLNAPGTIDARYKGEIKIILMNCGKEKYTINKEDKIAQIVFSRCYNIGITSEVCGDKIETRKRQTITKDKNTQAKLVEIKKKGEKKGYTSKACVCPTGK